MKKNKSGFVYVASVKGNPFICKVGYTNRSLKERLSELNRSFSGVLFEMYGAVESLEASQLESQCHMSMSKKLIGRELFEIKPEDAIKIAKGLVGKRFSVTSKDDLMRFNCCYDMELFEICKLHPKKASECINKIVKMHDIRGASNVTISIAMEIKESLLNSISEKEVG